MSTRRRSLMNLTIAQEGALWPMLTNACATAASLGLCEDSAKGKEVWRRNHLAREAGIESLKHIPRGGKVFAKVMAALQVVVGDGIEWIIKADSCKPHELIYHAQQMLRRLQIPEDYACGVARNALKLTGETALEDLEPEQLDRVIKIFYAQGKRIAEAAKPKRETGGDPF